jgi:hypothetical protein
MVIAISPADVGERVTIRRRLGDRLGDVVGELISWESGVLTVRRRNGEIVQIAENTLVAAKVVPPGRPASR